MTRIAPDANDILVLPLNDGPGTHVNFGTTGTADNWADYGNPISNVPGLININNSFSGIYIPGSHITTTHNGVGGAADTLVTPNMSLSGWVFLRRYTNYYAEIFVKQYYINGWSYPFLTFGFQLVNSNDGQLDLYITLNGALQSIRTPTQYTLPVGRWCHLGGTWNGSSLKMFINGTQVASNNFSGVIDYGTSGRGQWFVGGIPGSGTNQEAPVIVQDIRVANIARPQSYFANIYQQGFIG